MKPYSGPPEIEPGRAMNQYLARIAVYPHGNCTELCECWKLKSVPDIAYEVPEALEELRRAQAS